MDNELIDEEILETFPPFQVEELDKETILSDLVMDYLVALRDSSNKTRIVEKVRDKARELKVITAFNNIYKQTEREKGISLIKGNNYNTIIFPELEDTPYRTTSYKITDDGKILQSIPNRGDILVSYQPIIPVEKYKNLENGIEKIKIAFYDSNKWKDITVNRLMIATSQNIVKLADYGIEVTSENAKLLVKYLSEIINLNEDKILVNSSVSRLGWINEEFIPYSNKYLYDGDIDYKNIFEAVKESGSYELWKEKIKELRSKSVVLRFCMAASAASPLVEILKINSFIVHLWGKSSNGKTVAQMVCASIWGNPARGKLLSTLDNTKVASERLCNFLHNMPLILDELQILKDRDKTYDNLIYTLTEGKGRDRGTISGGIDSMTKWDNIIILSGEEPITSSFSKEGVKNRVIEIEENNTIIENGNQVVDLILKNYGFAGKIIIEAVQKKKDILDEFKNISEELKKHISYTKQINSIACILVADKILSSLIFEDEPIKIDDIKDYINKDTDEADRYINYIIDIANANLNRFVDSPSLKADNNKIPIGEIWGRVITDGNGEIEYYCFIPNKLYEILKNNRIDWTGIKKKFANKGYIEINQTKDRNEYTISQKINKVTTRVIKLKNINYKKRIVTIKLQYSSNH